MIELTEQQLQALAANGETPPTFVDPKTQTVYVLVRKNVYDLLSDPDYDDSPWTDEEMAALAWEAGKDIGWEDMDEFDDLPEKP